MALGTPYKAEEAEDLTYTSLKKTKGCDSTHGVGRMAAPEEDYETMYVTLPCTRLWNSCPGC